MVSKKSTKRALLTSVLCLVLCMSMLIGTTFAWFTDTVTSGVNQIVAGNLDVEVYYDDDGEQTSIQNVDTLFNDVDGDPILWEPGVVAYENLTVVNEGNLALKYALSINFDNENTVDGYGLSDVLQIAVVKDGINKSLSREQLVASITDWQPLSAWAVNDYLPEQGDAHTYGVVIWWEPSADDNNWNVNNGKEVSDLAATGKNELHIDLGIYLKATQLVAEEDSFGDDYDDGANLYVTTEAELVAALAAGGRVVLGDDITVSAPATVPEGVTAVLDLNGHNLSANNVTYALQNLGTLTLKDSVGTGAVTARGIYNGSTTVTTAKLTVENGVYNAIGEGGGAAVFNYGIAVINGGKFTSIDSYSLNNQDNGMMTINDATVTGGIYNMGALTVNDGEIATDRGGYTHAIYHAGTSLIVNDGVFSGNGNEVINANSSSAVINGGSFTKVEKTSYLLAGSEMVINGGTFIAYESDPAAHPVRPDVTVKGGAFNYQHQNIAAGYKTVAVTVNGKTWYYVVSNSTTVVTSTSELTSAISNAEEGDTVLMADDVVYGSTQLVIAKNVTIDLNGNELTTANNYGGMTLSNGASIKNGTINHTGNTAAIKVSGNAGSIENVTINMTPTAGKIKTGIQVYNGKYVEKISNVTINDATQGIEVAKGSRVDLIENATVQAVADGNTKGVALLVNAASVGEAVNCTFKGDYGVHMMLNGEFHAALELNNCTVTGSTAALYAHDEPGISNTTNCSLTLTYDAETKLNGAFVWDFEEECQSVVTLKNP